MCDDGGALWCLGCALAAAAARAHTHTHTPHSPTPIKQNKVLAHIDMAIQYGEDAEVRTRDFDEAEAAKEDEAGE